MKTEIPNAAAAVKSAAAGGLAISLDQISLAFFGVPIFIWVASLSGGLFGATWFPPTAPVSRWWVVASNTLAAVFLSGMVVNLWNGAQQIHAGVAFLIACGPIVAIEWARERFFPKGKE